MLGPRVTTVFRSRWNALFWAAGILATAYCSVPDANQTHQEQMERHAPARHANPWTKGPEQADK